MTTEEKRLLWNPVRDKLFSHILLKDQKHNQDVKRGKKLEEFLGCDEYRNWQKSQYYPMNADLKATLQALAGPHGETIYKAMCVRKGIAP